MFPADEQFNHAWNARLRKEYLFKKSQEAKDRIIQDRKRRIREAQLDGRPVPTELRHEESDLRRRNELDDAITREVSIDDEYANAGIRDPRILITTSRDPSSRLLQFVKELNLVFPNAQRLNRGCQVVQELVEAARAAGITDLIIAHEHRDGLLITHFPYGPTAYFGLMNTVLRHDLENRSTVSEQYPHLIFHNFKTPLGERCHNILKYLFPVPKPDSTRVMTFFNQNDFISFRSAGGKVSHHVFERHGTEIVLQEVGPRFEMRLYQISLGTADMKDADVEWALRPYVRSARKKDVI